MIAMRTARLFFYLCLSLLSGINIQLQSQVPPLKLTGLLDRSEVIMLWDEGSTNGARILEQNRKLKFTYQDFEYGERMIGTEKVVSDTTLSFSRRQFVLITGDFKGDNMADYRFPSRGL